MKLTFFTFLFFLSTLCLSQTIVGKVLDTDTKKPLEGVEVYLVNQKATEDTLNICYWEGHKYKVVAETRSDSLGKYKFLNIQKDVYNVIVVYEMPKLEKYDGGFGIRDDIDSNITVKSLVNHVKTFSLLVTCPYDKTKNQSFCPKCKRKDRVVPILFGLPIFDENGNIDGKSPGKYHLAGCFVDIYCNPTKHCNRCDKDF